MDQDMTLDASELPDEMDLASSEYMQSFTFRLRGRERVFLQKIEKASRSSMKACSGSATTAKSRSASSASRPAPRPSSASAARKTKSGTSATSRKSLS